MRVFFNLWTDSNNQMIEDIGKVLKVQGDQAFIEVERSSACAECGLQEAEEMTAGGKVVFQAFNMIQAKVGDRVKVRVQTAAYMKATLYVYGIPVLLMVIGAIFGMYISGAIK